MEIRRLEDITPEQKCELFDRLYRPAAWYIGWVQSEDYDEDLVGEHEHRLFEHLLQQTLGENVWIVLNKALIG